MYIKKQRQQRTQQEEKLIKYHNLVCNCIFNGYCRYSQYWIHFFFIRFCILYISSCLSLVVHNWLMTQVQTQASSQWQRGKKDKEIVSRTEEIKPKWHQQDKLILKYLDVSVSLVWRSIVLYSCKICDCSKRPTLTSIFNKEKRRIICSLSYVPVSVFQHL